MTGNWRPLSNDSSSGSGSNSIAEEVNETYYRVYISYYSFYNNHIYTLINLFT